MTKKILLSCIWFTISYCRDKAQVQQKCQMQEALRHEIKWSATGSTEIMVCPHYRYNISTLFKRKCVWEFKKCTIDFCRFRTLQEDDRINVNYNQSIGIYNLQISNMSSDDQGHYWCECYNFLSTYTMYILKIKGQPRFLEKDANNTLLGTEGNNLTLTCVLEGGLPPEQLLLTRDGLTVAYGGPENINYSFIPSRADHLTDYICIANSSEFDNPLADGVTLYIRHIPDPPTYVSLHTCTSISVSWTPGASGNLPQVFHIEYKKEKTKLWQRISPIKQTSTTEMTSEISEVSFDSFYEIRIFAENELGRSIYSPVVRTSAFVIKSMNEYNFGSKPLVPLQYWLMLGAVTVSLVLICILSHISHICKYCGIKHPGSSATNRQLETLYEEIRSVQYQFISVAPVFPAPRDLPGSFDNAEPDAALPEVGSDQITSEQYYGQVVNVTNLQLHQQNDNLEPEFDSTHSVEQTVNAENYENPYTPLRHDMPEEHHYSLCRNSGVFPERSTQPVVDNSDYINLML